ncbi:MAG: glycosyltransferase [Chloroflexota bacterium]
MRSILLTRGTEGDLLPFLQIGKALKQRGHSVVFMTHVEYAQKVKASGLDYVPVGHVNDFDELISQKASFHARDFVAGLKQGLPSLLSGYERHRDLFDGGDTLLVAHHNTHLGAQFIAERHGIPAVSVFTAPHFVLNMPFWEQAYRLAAAELNEIRAAMTLPPVGDWASWWRALGNFLGLWPDWYARPDASWPVAVEPAGFILDDVAGKRLPSDVEQVVAGPTPTLLITHATSSTNHAHFFDLSMAACRAMGWQAILVTPHRHLLPETLPTGMYAYPALPFPCLLPRVKVAIHHGGIGTLAHALAAGTPQLILGVGFDRPDNGARAKRLGFAEFIPVTQWRVETIYGALQHLTTSLVIESQCKRLSAQVVADCAVERACDYLEHAALAPPVTFGQAGASPPHPAHEHPSALSDTLSGLSSEKLAWLATRVKRKKLAQ